MNINDVVIHVNETLDTQARRDLEDQMRDIDGVIAPKFEIYEGTAMTMPAEYAAIKSAVIHLSRYIAKSLKGMHIRVNCISPGGILDRQADAFLKAYGDQCLNRGMLDASDINGTLIFLLSQASKDINGQNIIVDDGFTL
jgi:NAD(P)-dependent dehydrogenase (short-subunit alcohol dehydrogenase family)